MNKYNKIIATIFLSSTLMLTACSNNEQTYSTKNAVEYTIENNPVLFPDKNLKAAVVVINAPEAITKEQRVDTVIKAYNTFISTGKIDSHEIPKNVGLTVQLKLNKNSAFDFSTINPILASISSPSKDANLWSITVSSHDYTADEKKFIDLSGHSELLRHKVIDKEMSQAADHYSLKYIPYDDIKNVILPFYMKKMNISEDKAFELLSSVITNYKTYYTLGYK